MTYLLFVPRPSGYELLEREGEPPARGMEIDLGDEGGRMVIAKIAPSPLPDDDRPCAFLLPR